VVTALDAPPLASDDLLGLAERAMRSAREHLVSLQNDEGWWKGELETNVTMDAEDLLLRHFLGILDHSLAERSARWIRGNRRSDGTWATFFGGPPDLSTTVEAYVALRLAGDDPAEPAMRQTAEWVRAHGGIGATRVFTRIWLALVGGWNWEDLPVLPAEIMFLPAWAPLNIYDFGCWARQTIVPLTVLMSFRPSRALPFDLTDLAEGDEPPTRKVDIRSTARRFEALDRLLHRYERLPRWVFPRRLLRKAALRRAEAWILKRQEADGLWGGIQPPVVYSVMALHVLGYPLDHPVLGAAFAGLDAFTIEDVKGRRIEACQSPVWDTALAVLALCDAGMDPKEPSMRAAVQWMLGEEVRVPGDWAVRRPGLEPSGWAFEFANDNYADIDDTAEVVLALRAAGAGDPEVEAACRRAVAWTVGMQSRSGGWGAFDADNCSRLVASLPFCDFGEVTDPPSADVTAHVLEMLAKEPGAPADVVATGLAWLSAQQEDDGSWFGRWGVNHVYGTGAAVPALIAAGVSGDDIRVRRAVMWLAGSQNADGGWGEDLRSYIDPAWRGRGTSTPSQTAWALLALLAAGERDSDLTERGVRWLAANQEPDGGWDEPWFTGTGFPWDFSINYHLYRHVWPLMALGRYVKGGSS
jgi:squalene-hopene/tetraprenyl-beta-curcumene cyclase